MLGKKQKRDFDRTVLHQVKAKPMKGPGIPASLGLRKGLHCCLLALPVTVLPHKLLCMSGILQRDR